MLCLPKENSDAFKRALKDGSIKIPDLLKMTTEERQAAFASVVGEEYAQAVNTMFEKKLLLKHQQAGLIDWIKEVGGLKPEQRRDLIARIQRREKAFTAEDESKFLNDVADQTLGTSVSHAEAKKIFELTKKVEAAKGYTGVNDIEDLVTSFEKLDQSKLSPEDRQAITDLRTKVDAEKAAEVAEKARVNAEKQKIRDHADEERKAVREQKAAEKKVIQEQKAKEREVVQAKAKEERVQAAEKAKAARETARADAKDKKLDQQLEEQIKRDAEKREKEIAAQEFKAQQDIEKAQAKEDARLEREIAKEDARISRQEQEDQARFDRETTAMEKSTARKNLQAATGESLKRMKTIFQKITNQKFKGIEQFGPEMQARLEDIVAKREAIANGQDRLIYGHARVELRNYVNSLSQNTIGEQFRESPFRFVAGLTKSLKATFDNSVLLRQGLKTLFNNPKIWMPNAAKSFKDIWDTFGGKAVMDNIDADIVSRENYPLYERMEVDVNTKEELHPTSLPEKIPFIGRAFQASENAFTGFLHRTRADLADFYIAQMKSNGVELTDERLKNFGKLINSQTGRGTFGPKGEQAADTLNMAFFSIRNLKANFDTLTAHMFDSSIRQDPVARRAAIESTLKVIGGIATILAIAKAMNPDSVELDPRSSDFGKIKIGDTRFDVTAGMSSLVVVAARLINQSTKSTMTGKVTPLGGTQFGAKTGRDVMVDFFANKLSPMASFLEHVFITHQDNAGKPITAGGELGNLFLPLPFTNANEILQDPNSAPFVAAVLADSFGISMNTYSASVKQQHTQQITDSVKKNYEAKQAGEQTKTASEIAKEVYGSPNQTQINAVQSEMDFYKTFGEDNTYANEIHDAQQASDVIDVLDNAKADLSTADFKKFYNKALDSKLISSAMDKKWQTYEETGVIEGGDTQLNTDGQKSRTVVNIITSFAKAVGTSPIEAFKLLLKNQSIRTTENGTIIVNRNTNFFDTVLGQSGYSDRVRKELDANKDQKLDHTVPIEGGGQDEASDLALISTEEWKKNSVVENLLGKALKAGKINGKQLREYAIRYKAGRGQPISQDLQNEYQKKYADIPLTVEQIRELTN